MKAELRVTRSMEAGESRYNVIINYLFEGHSRLFYEPALSAKLIDHVVGEFQRIHGPAEIRQILS